MSAAGTESALPLPSERETSRLAAVALGKNRRRVGPSAETPSARCEPGRLAPRSLCHSLSFSEAICSSERPVRTECSSARFEIGAISLPLLLKSGSDIAPISKRAEEHSVLTGRSLEQIASENDREWQSDRGARRPGSQRAEGVSALGPTRRRFFPRATAASRDVSRSDGNGKADSVPAADINLQRLPKAKPDFVEPMKALLVEELPKGADWIYELKFDG